ncbi:MAG: CYTH domain-containing protein [Patescibacteria group bacterium]|jgi:adenylate cyclase class IV|nr:CYTH domain-containing protein [Patescibacteria group bacterium]
MSRINQHSKTRECEVKYQITDKTEKKLLLAKVKALDFKFKTKQLEADFVPDTPGFLCRQNGLLLRFREIKSKNNDILITLKIKNKNGAQGVKDNFELQYFLSQPDLLIFKKINTILKKYTKQSLPPDINLLKDFKKLRQALPHYGFDQYRTFIEKKREIYSNSQGEEITFDQFPEQIGNYLEIETKSPAALKKLIASLGLGAKRLITTDYGDIVKAKKSGLPEFESRTCVFKK